MSKYKIKRKTSKNLYIAVVVICILIITSIGYSLWKDTLYIKGSIYAKYVEPKLELVTVNKVEDRFVGKKEDISSGLTGITFNSTNLKDDDILEISAEFKSGRYLVIGRQADIYMNFTNDYPVQLTDGKYELIPEENPDNQLDYDITVTLPEIIEPGEPAKINLSFRLRSGMTGKTGKARYRISYKVGEVTRYLYFSINLVK